MPDDSLHEALVAAFLLQAESADPKHYAHVCAKHPVKSSRQLQRIAKAEFSVGLFPGKFLGDFSLTQREAV